LGFPPSFVISGVIPGLFATAQAVVDYLPVIPSPSLHTELPLAVVDGFTRAMLLCSFIPPSVITNTSREIATSPWTLLLTSLVSPTSAFHADIALKTFIQVTTNGGFFLANMFSFLHPTPFTLTTPPELLPYGWTATDLWCAPLITGLYALLTHAQPFWAEAHTFIIRALGDGKTGVAVAVDPDVARAACAVLLSILFIGRTIKNFGGQWKQLVLRKTKTD
jgi:hypothetical protein